MKLEVIYSRLLGLAGELEGYASDWNPAYSDEEGAYEDGKKSAYEMSADLVRELAQDVKAAIDSQES